MAIHRGLYFDYHILKEAHTNGFLRRIHYKGEPVTFQQLQESIVQTMIRQILQTRHLPPDLVAGGHVTWSSDNVPLNRVDFVDLMHRNFFGLCNSVTNTASSWVAPYSLAGVSDLVTIATTIDIVGSCGTSLGT